MHIFTLTLTRTHHPDLKTFVPSFLRRFPPKMALKTIIPFPIFTPISTTTTVTTTPTTTEIRFSRWHNANADKFNHHRRTQQQIEDDLRRHRRFESALNIANHHPSSPSTTTTFKSTGTPSSPSLPSIPGKKSKYSKPNPNPSHPAFRNLHKKTKLPENEIETTVKVEDNGLSYVVPGAPFEFMYSYTEAPKVRPIGLREPPVAPFGPTTMPRPWTGRKPLPPSKKKLPEFDSFTPPPANKKGVKPVQKPGPFLPGSGPRYVMSRDEILGEPLTVEEVKELVEGCRKTKRQLNMGRDGLTHNMLDNIHAHWKRRRVCKIKCKGVCTVDMDNVCQQLEEKTGGKIIYRRGGIVYLFRGRNYNYKTRPRYPLMLWKPVTPVYPRLIKRVPEGLTLEEATDMRRRGRELPPICKLGKNGVYANLAKDVREAFEACELVRVNCQGLNPSDYRKIGAKLKDLVPCVLISFEYEHILMWRGRDWKSSYLSADGGMAVKNSETDDDPLFASDDDEESTSCSSNILIQETSNGMANADRDMIDDSGEDVRENLFGKDDVSSEINGPPHASDLESQTMFNSDSLSGDRIKFSDHTCYKETGAVDNFFDEKEPNSTLAKSDSGVGDDIVDLQFPRGDSPADDGKALQEMTHKSQESSRLPLDSPCRDGVLFLLRQAVEAGSAVILDDSSLDADVVYEKTVAFAQVAPSGPVFRHRPQKISLQRSGKQETGDLEADKEVLVAENKSNVKKPKGRKSSKTLKAKDFKEDYLNIVPQGSLKVDELAKLLA